LIAAADLDDELVYTLPDDDLKSFATLFKGLEQQKEAFGI